MCVNLEGQSLTALQQTVFTLFTQIHMGTGFVIEPYRGSPTTSLVTYFVNVREAAVAVIVVTTEHEIHDIVYACVKYYTTTNWIYLTCI